MLQFRLQRHHIINIGQHIPEIGAERKQKLPGLLRLLPAETGDGIQRVKQEMRINLRLQRLNLCPPQMLLLLFHIHQLQLSREVVCQAGDKLNLRPVRIRFFPHQHYQRQHPILAPDNGSRQNHILGIKRIKGVFRHGNPADTGGPIGFGC